MTEPPSPGRRRPGISRAAFLTRTFAAMAAAGSLPVIAACGEDERQAIGTADTEAAAFGPLPPENVPPPGILAFFDEGEARTVEAAAARIIPGSADDPGAREAGVLAYIDNKLARFPTFAEPTYHEGPWAEPVDDRHPGPRRGDSIPVARTELTRYGFQSRLTPRQAYRAGLSALDAWSRRRFGRAFAELPERRQDTILTEVQHDRAATFTHPSAAGFFGMLQKDVVEGMFADPAYGGNRDLAGWRLIGYPGAQRAYTPRDMRTPGNRRPPQSLRQMRAMHAGHPDDHVDLPLASTTRTGG